MLAGVSLRFTHVMNNLSGSFSLLSQDTLLCEHCGKNRLVITRYSEGYGTEVMCVFLYGKSDLQASIDMIFLTCFACRPKLIICYEADLFKG